MKIIALKNKNLMKIALLYIILKDMSKDASIILLTNKIKVYSHQSVSQCFLVYCKDTWIS
jgi:hypothetical protein